MANILSVIAKKYQKTNTRVEQVSLVIGIIAVGALLINFSNRNNNIQSTDNNYPDFACELSSQSDLLTLDTSELKTNTALSLINFDTEVYETGLMKNDIPAIYNPDVVSLDTLEPCVGADDEFIVVEIAKEKRAYSKRLLRFHVAINDTINNENILITYSPLGNYFQVFKRDIKDEVYQFGISGLLYKNTDLLFDSKTESLWSVLNGKAIVGNMIGASLETIPFKMERYDKLTKLDVNTISFKTGFIRDYNDDPFLAYSQDNKEIVSKITNFSDSLPYKTMVAGFMIDNQAYAFVIPELTDTKKIELDDMNYNVEIENRTIKSITTDNNEVVEFKSLYWFVWYDYQPKTILLELQ